MPFSFRFKQYTATDRLKMLIKKKEIVSWLELKSPYAVCAPYGIIRFVFVVVVIV